MWQQFSLLSSVMNYSSTHVDDLKSYIETLASNAINMNSKMKNQN
jgi:hypothetical protein